MAGLFKTPEQVRAEEQAQRLSMIGSNPYAAAYSNLGNAIGKGIGGLFGVDPRSASEKKAMDLQEVTKGISIKEPESVMRAADTLFQKGYQVEAMALAERAQKMLVSPKAASGDQWQLVKKGEDGNWTQVGTKWVSKGEQIPPIPQNQQGTFEWRKIGTGQPLATATATTGDDTNPLVKKFLEQVGKDSAGQYEAAQNAVKSLESQKVAIELLNEGMISGFGANIKVSLGKALQAAGFNYAKDEVANAEAFGAVQAKQVAEIIKAFGAGTGLSDADREFARQAAAGDITMTEQAIRRIIDINNRASMAVIKAWNKKAEGFNKLPGSPFGFSVEVPEMPQASFSTTGVLEEPQKEQPRLPPAQTVEEILQRKLD